MANEKTLGCYACLGTPYSHKRPAANEAEQIDEAAIAAMIDKICAGGFQEVIPWIDFPPGYFATPTGEIPTAETLPAYVERVQCFVQQAKAAGLRVQLYFGLGTGEMGVWVNFAQGQKLFHINALGQQFPQCATYHREGRSSLELALAGAQPIAFASLAYPAVRTFIADWIIDLAVHSGVDGIQLEPLTMPVDEKGVCLYGYETPMLESFQQRYGISPLELDNSDAAWLEHRCRLTTQLVQEIRARLQQAPQPLELSVMAFHLAEDPKRFFWPWEEWLRERLVDSCYVMTGSLTGLAENLAHIGALCAQHGLRWAAALCVKSYSELQTPEQIAAGVRIIQASRAQHMMIYGLAFLPGLNPKEAPVTLWQQARKLIS